MYLLSNCFHTSHDILVLQLRTVVASALSKQWDKGNRMNKWKTKWHYNLVLTSYFLKGLKVFIMSMWSSTICHKYYASCISFDIMSTIIIYYWWKVKLRSDFLCYLGSHTFHIIWMSNSMTLFPAGSRRRPNKIYGIRPICPFKQGKVKNGNTGL